MEYYVNENTLKERLQIYFIKNQRSSKKPYWIVFFFAYVYDVRCVCDTYNALCVGKMHLYEYWNNNNTKTSYRFRYSKMFAKRRLKLVFFPLHRSSHLFVMTTMARKSKNMIDCSTCHMCVRGEVVKLYW